MRMLQIAVVATLTAALPAHATETAAERVKAEAAASLLEAQPTLFTRVTIDAMLGIMKEAGYAAKVVDIDGGGKRIDADIAGGTTSINFFDCGEDGCLSIEVSTGFVKDPKYTLAYVNKWNLQQRFVKAYVDTDEGVVLEYDINVDGGLTADALKADLKLFEQSLSDFADFT